MPMTVGAHLADVLELLGAHIVSVDNERLVKGVQQLAQLLVVCGREDVGRFRQGSASN